MSNMIALQSHAMQGAAPAAAPDNGRRWRALAVVVAAQFIFVVDAFVVNVALPSIRADLHATSGEMAAVLATYQIAYATLVITGGRLGDIYGRRRVLILGVIGFTAASVWCGLSRSGTELIAARLAQGGAAALMVPQVLATIHALFPDAARGRAFAVFGITLGLGGAAGFALGGWLVTLNPAGIGWRSVFLVNAPIGAGTVMAARRLLPRCQRSAGTRLDWPATILLFVALMTLMGPVMAGRDLHWPVWLFGLIATGAGLLALMPRLERRVARSGGLPLIDLDLLTDCAFRRGLLTAFAFQFGNLSFYLVMTLYLQDWLGLTPLLSGSAAVPLALAFTVASRLAGAWMPRFGLLVLLAGVAIQLRALAALIELAVCWPATALLGLVPVLTAFGFGQGLVMAPLSGIVLATVRQSHAGSASGILNTVHQTAGAAGVSLVGTVWFQYGMTAAVLLLCLSSLVTAWLLDRMRRIANA